MPTQYTPPYLVDWKNTAGVPGKIPKNLVADATIGSTYDRTDRSGVIQAALSACPVGKKVLLTGGNFYYATFLTVPTGVTLAGAGMNVTNLYYTGASVQAIYAGTTSAAPQGDDWPNPSSGNVVSSAQTAGTTTVTIADTSGFTVGEMIRAEVAMQANPVSIAAGAIPEIMVSGRWPLRTQMMKLASKTSTTLTFSPGLFWTSTGQTMTMKSSGSYSIGVGIQDLTLDCSKGTPPYGIFYQGCQASWIYNVKVYKSTSYGIFFLNTFQCTIKHSDVRDIGTGGSNASGILFGTNGSGACSCLVEDNIVLRVVPHVEMDYGCTGNAFLHNYFYDSHTFTTVGPSLDTNHGPHNSFNLYEGNRASNAQCDGFFGGTSEDTYHRNWYTGTSPGADTRSPILFNRMTYRCVLTGNILGTPGDVASSMYQFGLPNIGNTSFTGTCQPSLGSLWGDFNIHGTLTTRTSATVGVITCIGGPGSVVPGPDYNNVGIRWGAGPANTRQFIQVDSVVGNLISFSVGTQTLGGDLPVVGTAIQVWAGPTGYQEKDLDVAATTILKANFNYLDNAIPAGESLGAETLAPSYYYDSKPDFWPTNGMPWPPFDPYSPNPSEVAIPAGYRNANGGMDPPDTPVPGLPAGSAMLL